MTRESIVQVIGILVALATILVTVAGLVHLLAA
jgi:hypothetical protein